MEEPGTQGGQNHAHKTPKTPPIRLLQTVAIFLSKLACPGGLEPSTCRLEGGCSSPVEL